MSFVTKLFGNKYDDEQIVSHAQTAIIHDPVVTDAATIGVTSERGVVTLTGTVHKGPEKDRIEGIVRRRA